MAPKPWRKAFVENLCNRALILHVVAFFATAVALWIIDPIGAATRSENATISLLYRIAAPLYPPPAESEADYSDPFAQTVKISVIMITDRTLQRARYDPATGDVCIVHETDTDEGVFCDDLDGEGAGPGAPLSPRWQPVTWPPPYYVHAAILQKIVQSVQPKAVFIDIGFFDARSPAEVEALQKTLCTYAMAPTERLSVAGLTPSSRVVTCQERRGEVPILMPDLGLRDPSGMRTLPAVAGAATGVVSTRYVAEDPDSYNEYPRFDCDAEMLTPAMALHLLSKPEAAVPDQPCGGLTPGHPISLYWATWGGEDWSRGAYPCTTLPETAGGRAAAIFGLWLEEIFAAFGDHFFGRDRGWQGHEPTTELEQICPPHLTISAHQLLSDNQGLDLSLDGAFVFYGGNFAMADDLIRPPTHRLIPGVYWHAMALDNLEREAERVTQPRLEIGLTLLAILVTGICHSMLVNGRQAIRTVFSDENGYGGIARFGVASVWNAIWAGLCLLILVGITLYSFFIARTPPINFAGIILVGSFGQLNDMVKVHLGSLGQVFLVWFRGLPRR